MGCLSPVWSIIYLREEIDSCLSQRHGNEECLKLCSWLLDYFNPFVGKWQKFYTACKNLSFWEILAMAYWFILRIRCLLDLFFALGHRALPNYLTALSLPSLIMKCKTECNFCWIWSLKIRFFKSREVFILSSTSWILSNNVLFFFFFF